MDDAGIDMALLRMPVWQEWLPLDICKVVNDQAAQMQRDSEGRLRFNAVLPPWGRKEDIKELERCIDMGAVGVQFACCYGDKFLDDELFKPYLKVLNDKKIPGGHPPHAWPERLRQLRRVHGPAPRARPNPRAGRRGLA